ncbi:MAG: pyrimidine operon attenuation protein/uracil phosphoribosyltransferase [Candidatus Paceibacteria bacterium]|jgi:pyrimidine operon attenuation protein/uracil phosphoribosyltransferase
MPILPHELDAEALYAHLEQQIVAALGSTEQLALVGIYSGGAWLAERLAKALKIEDRLGFIDVSFYRDDVAEKGLHAAVKPSQVGFDVEGATILLVDDVLYTGRTTRAAMNELFDYGRPACILLATLVDRGGRELPIAPDFAAATVTLASDQNLTLQQGADGALSLTVNHA